VLFYLKENNKNLGLKIEGSRSIDPDTGVHYFSPPENIFDIDDLTKEELDRLLNQIKSLGYYDRVIVDITSDLNDINISVLEKSDMIFAVLPCHPIAEIKARHMQSAFEILGKRRGIRLLEKLELIMNNCSNSTAHEVEDLRIGDKPALLKIPYINGFDIRLGTACLKDFENPIGSGVSQIVNKFYR
jgi:Flp pilus assembly CpaE family ATPase